MKHLALLFVLLAGCGFGVTKNATDCRWFAVLALAAYPC